MDRVVQKFRSFADLQTLGLLAIAFLLAAKPVPYSNELSYLPRLQTTYDPNFLNNDITFSTATNEYWLFEHIFGLFTFVFSLQTIGWCGRILCWLLIFHAIRKLGSRWEIPGWLVTVSIAVWLLLDQCVVADEWIVGTFEAKCAAYICLIYALDRICKGRDILAAILLGLSFSFHPLIGMWGIFAAIPAQFIAKRNFMSTLRITLISGLFSLIGLIPLLLMRAESITPSVDSLKYFLLVRFPYHCDPFAWSRSELLLPFLLLGFSIAVYFYSKRTPSMTFLTLFLTFLGLFYCLAISARYFQAYELLKFMPARVFVVFNLLFFILSFSKAIYEKLYRKPLIAALMVLSISGMLWAKMFSRPVVRIPKTIEAWREPENEYLRMYRWASTNTDSEAIFIAPPWNEEFWYYSNRAMVVNYDKAISAEMDEWVTRLNILTGKADLNAGARDVADIKHYYESISSAEMIEISNQYKASIIITEAIYPFKILHEEGKLRAYKVSANGRELKK